MDSIDSHVWNECQFENTCIIADNWKTSNTNPLLPCQILHPGMSLSTVIACLTGPPLWNVMGEEKCRINLFKPSRSIRWHSIISFYFFIFFQQKLILLNTFTSRVLQNSYATVLICTECTELNKIGVKPKRNDSNKNFKQFHTRFSLQMKLTQLVKKTEEFQIHLCKRLLFSPLSCSVFWCTLERDAKPQTETAMAFSVQEFENKPLFSHKLSFLNDNLRHACLRVAMLFQCQTVWDE